MSEYLFTSESVSEGHPDKLADRISDTVLDQFLAADPSAKVACETFIADDLVVIAGEFHTDAETFETIQAEIPDIVRSVLRDIGYSSAFPGIDPDRCIIQLKFNQQSADIHRGVEQADEIIGAGDQGLVFGYATDETPGLMPLALMLSHQLLQRLSELRHSADIPWLRPDAKSQVTVRYVDNEPTIVHTVVLSTQHAQDIDIDTVREVIRRDVVDIVIPEALRDSSLNVLINPTGRFVIGGPQGDTGLTGRKIVVDTYGGYCPHGGGAFSGKDPTKVDRSAAYMARYVAKNIVAAGLSRKCTVQIAYAIGVAEPVSVYLDFHGTGTVKEEQVIFPVKRLFDLTPAGIIQTLKLRRPIYQQTSVYGHFGRDLPDFLWERTDKVDALSQAVNTLQQQLKLDGSTFLSKGF